MNDTWEYGGKVYDVVEGECQNCAFNKDYDACGAAPKCWAIPGSGVQQVIYIERKEKQNMLDFTKPIRTRDGRQVKILTTERKGNTPVVALVCVGNNEFLHTYYSNGRWSDSYETATDLVNIPEQKVLYVNVLPNGTSCCYLDKEMAAIDASATGSGCFKVTFEDGKYVKVENAQLEDGDWQPGSTFQEWNEALRYIMDKTEAGWLPEDEYEEGQWV